jgi:N-acetyltransferase 10
VRNATKSGKANPEVSVKSAKQKRKAGPTANEVYEEVFGEKEKSRKKAKKGKKGAA